MTRLDRMRRACAAFVVAGFVMPVAVAAPAPKGQGPKAPVPAAAQPPPAVVALGRLHHVAQREIALGLMAQVAAFRPETVRFATDLETDFRVLDRHIVAIADAHGIGEERLRQAYADDNTLALDGQTDDLDRLSMVRGKDFIASSGLRWRGISAPLRSWSPRWPEPFRASTRSLPRQRGCSIVSSVGRPRRKPARARHPRADLGAGGTALSRVAPRRSVGS
jgi:hypothetical protein